MGEGLPRKPEYPNRGRILITGADGFIGRQLCPTLAAEGYFVRGSVRHKRAAETPNTEYVATGPLENPIEWHPLLEGIDFIIHLAAVSDFGSPPDSESLKRLNTINVEVPVQIAEAAARSGVSRYIFLSSIKVHGEFSGSRAFSDTDKPDPESHYGVSKLRAEERLKHTFTDTESELVIIRPALVYGPAARGSVLKLMNLVNRQIPLPLGSIRNRRSMISVRNLCDLIRTALIHPAAAGQTFLAADDTALSTPELIREIAHQMGRRAQLVPVPLLVLQFIGKLLGKQKEITSLSASLEVDANNTRTVLNWSPPEPQVESLQKMVDYYLQRQT